MTKYDKPGRPKARTGMTHMQRHGVIDAHKKAHTPMVKAWNRRRDWYQSRWSDPNEERPQGSGEEATNSEIHFETNSAYAFVDSMIASVVPLNPAVTVNPRRPDLLKYAKAREALANDRMARMKLYKKLWQTATHAGIYQRGFLKASWNPNKKEVRIRVVDPRYVFFDMGAESWESIRYVCEVTVVTRETFEQRVKRGLYDQKVADKAAAGGYPSWLQDKSKDRSHINDVARDVFEWVTVYEFYDFTGEGRFCQYLEECEEPLYEGSLPYTMLRNPFAMLTFNDNLEDLGGMSDVQLIESALDQLNELDLLELTFAKSSIPMAFIHTGLAKNPKDVIEAYRTGGQPGSFVPVEADPGFPIDNILAFSRPPGLVPEHAHMRAQAMETINFVLGLPEYSRGKIGGADIATEVALADSATRTRNGKREKAIFSIVEWCSEAIINLYEEYFPNTDQLYVRLTGDEEMLGITRETAGFRDMKQKAGELPLEYDYEVIPYSPTENSRLVQMKNLTQSWPMVDWLLQMGLLNEQKLGRHIGHVLQLPPATFKTREELAAMQQQMAMAAQQPQGLPAPPAQGGEDTLATGNIPMGMEPTDAIGLPLGGPGDGNASPVPEAK